MIKVKNILLHKNNVRRMSFLANELPFLKLAILGIVAKSSIIAFGEPL